MALENPLMDLEEHSAAQSSREDWEQKLEWLSSTDEQNRVYYSSDASGEEKDTWNFSVDEGEALADYLDCPLSSLYAMATFYKALSLKPKGRHIIKLCDGTACHIRGSVNLVSGVERLLGIQAGETSADGQFSLELVNCLGSCALAPVMVVDDTYYGKVTMERLPEILAQYREEGGA